MKKTCCLIPVTFFASLLLHAQTSELREGNKLYREGKFDEALAAYEKAVKKSPGDITAMYNRANAIAKKGDRESALASYQQVLEQSKDNKVLERALYDKGVLHQQLQQLDQSIESWKAALRLDPDDQQARENLQKALRERQKQEENQKKDQQQEQPKNKKEQDQQKPQQQQQSRLNQQQVEQLLRALEQKEKEVQKKMQQKSASSNRPEKDW